MTEIVNNHVKINKNGRRREGGGGNSDELEEFTDLLKGKINLVDYISPDPDIDSLGSSNTLIADDRLSSLMDGNSLNRGYNGGHVSNYVGQHSTANLLHRMSMHEDIDPALQAAQFSALQQRQQQSSYNKNPPRLPESPPQTDSGATSAGSPSGSETSPCSPDYNSYAFGPSSVIVPSPNMNVSPSKYNSVTLPSGIILNPACYGGDCIPFPQNTRMNMNGHNNAGQSVLSNGNFYANQANSNSVQQISPPHPNGSFSQYNNGPAFQHSESIPGKRRRVENGQYVKSEPSSSPKEDDNIYQDESTHQSIRFDEFEPKKWNKVYGTNGRDPVDFSHSILADKGFNFVSFDSAFVNQKKNHFQVTVEFSRNEMCIPKFVRTEDGMMRPILGFELDFFGVKSEMHTCEIMIRQSQTDRKPMPYRPTEVDLLRHSRWKQSVPRLHFSETTMNNQRKNGRPNADQKYFLLVVALNAVVPSISELGQEDRCRVMAYASDKVIVRASNPGQFDNGDNEVHWQKGPDNGVYHIGPVGINTDKQLGSLTVKGNIHCFGDIVHPSDARLKENIRPIDATTAMERIKNIEFCKYDIKPEIAEEWGLPDDERRSIVGVIAQEVQPIIADAVKDCGEYLTVREGRIFMESAIVTKELCLLTTEMDGRVSAVEKMYNWLAKRVFKKGLPPAASNLSLDKSASVCGSYLSGSKSTVGKSDDTHCREKLSSSAKSDKNKSGYQYQNYHIGRVSNDQSLCNSRIITSIVVILLLVMVFCIVAMATLFILDWRNRHSYGLPYPAMFPKKKPNEPPMGFMSIQKTHSQTTTASSGRKRPGVPPPLHACNHLHCEKYCCDDYTFSQIFDGRKSKNGGGRFIVIAKNVRPLGKNYRFPRRAVVDISNNKPTSINHKLTYDVSGSSNTSLFAESIIRPAVRVLGSDNVTLDNRYCMSDDCNDALRGNYSFFVPISSYMPHIPLNVKFDIGPLDYAMFCNQRPGPLCYGIDASVLDTRRNLAQVQQRARDMWELPVGLFIDSYYTFRIGSSTTLCSMPNDEIGASFVEYTLWFYRACDSQAS